MINFNLTEKEKDSIQSAHAHYLDSIDEEAHEYIMRICEALPDRAELVAASMNPLYSKKTKEKLPTGPSTWMRYNLDGYTVMVEYGNFWAFQGPVVVAEKLEYDGKRYFYNFFYDPVRIGVEEVIERCLNPAAARAKQKAIPNFSKGTDNREYKNTVRKAERQLYF
jgi:hypothetical protein